MKTKITRAILIMPDDTRNIIRPNVTVDHIEKYRTELQKLTGAVKVLFDMEETGKP